MIWYFLHSSQKKIKKSYFAIDMTHSLEDCKLLFQELQIISCIRWNDWKLLFTCSQLGADFLWSFVFAYSVLLCFSCLESLFSSNTALTFSSIKFSDFEKLRTCWLLVCEFVSFNHSCYSLLSVFLNGLFLCLNCLHWCVMLSKPSDDCCTIPLTQPCKFIAFRKVGVIVCVTLNAP